LSLSPPPLDATSSSPSRIKIISIPSSSSPSSSHILSIPILSIPIIIISISLQFYNEDVKSDMMLRISMEKNYTLALQHTIENREKQQVMPIYVQYLLRLQIDGTACPSADR